MVIDIHMTAPPPVQFVADTQLRTEKMWKSETRKHRIKYESLGKEEWIDSPALVREDGVSLMLIGQGREKQLDFIYSEGEESFRFTATRYFDEGQALTETWTVLLGSGFNGLENRIGTSISFARARQIADNIRDGLLAWRWYGTDKPPAKKVRFRVKSWRHWSPALGWGE
jgi:hypothetical protein